MKTNTDKFTVHNAKTERYRKSAVPFMQRLLNEDAKQIKKILT